jgi:hypothetical protein
VLEFDVPETYDPILAFQGRFSPEIPKRTIQGILDAVEPEIVYQTLVYGGAIDRSKRCGASKL